MTRALLPGRWSRDGRAIPNPVPHPHLERVTLTELDNEIAPCPLRTFKPRPVETPRVHKRTLLIALAAVAAFALLLWIASLGHKA